MAKGQKRGNREHKKPKQPKTKTAMPTSTFAVTQSRPAAFVPGKKK